jgi:alkanesulfonate monooxygenase SsuD/methylene tetrahydromethanopterin reductase-like flavin-dependent oxidoreductase (luciferase family)/predicted kinase
VERPLVDPSLVILVGPSGSGKSTWASERFRPEEIVSSDHLRAIVGSGENDLDASAEAFTLLDQIVAARLRRRLMTVVDTLGLDDERRQALLDLAARQGMEARVVVFDTSEEVVRMRNRARHRPVPERVLTSQIRRYRQLRPRLAALESLVVAGDQAVEPVHAPQAQAAAAEQARRPTRLRFYLQVSRFPFAELPAGLAELAATAEALGFAGVALMDHLVQIPQVGREWEAFPEAYTTLAYLAGRTSRLEVGALVTGVTLRNPALLAKMVATLDVLSGGRAFCGLGTGWHAAEQRAYGYPVGTPGERVRALEDTLRILPLMWGPGKASYQGQVHSVTEATCYPRPVREHLPLLVGGRGPRLIDLAVRLADGFNTLVSRWERVVPAVQGRLEEVGRSREDFEISVLDTPLVGSSRSQVAEMVERWRGSRSAEEFSRRHHAATAEVHIGRYRQMADQGVGAVFVAPTGLESPQSLQVWEKIIGSFSS